MGRKREGGFSTTTSYALNQHFLLILGLLLLPHLRTFALLRGQHAFRPFPGVKGRLGKRGEVHIVCRGWLSVARSMGAGKGGQGQGADDAAAPRDGPAGPWLNVPGLCVWFGVRKGV